MHLYIGVSLPKLMNCKGKVKGPLDKVCIRPSMSLNLVFASLKTKYGSYKLLVMPFGLSNNFITFMRLMKYNSSTASWVISSYQKRLQRLSTDPTNHHRLFFTCFVLTHIPPKKLLRRSPIPRFLHNKHA